LEFSIDRDRRRHRAHAAAAAAAAAFFSSLSLGKKREEGKFVDSLFSFLSLFLYCMTSVEEKEKEKAASKSKSATVGGTPTDRRPKRTDTRGFRRTLSLSLFLSLSLSYHSLPSLQTIAAANLKSERRPLCMFLSPFVSPTGLLRLRASSLCKAGGFGRPAFGLESSSPSWQPLQKQLLLSCLNAWEEQLTTAKESRCWMGNGWEEDGENEIDREEIKRSCGLCSKIAQ
jgi:hypothetical protein